MANFPLINEASLVMASGAYKEGKIYSQLPTDGSGDFTFTRGTDTATRVNKDGYIEKERANLLLQSNQFDTTWTGGFNTSVTNGQSGYDGTNDAWLLSKSASNSYILQDISASGVQTFSVYAKAETSSWLRLVANTSNFQGGYFDLSNGVTGGVENAIDTKIENVGNGWYRCIVIFNGSTTRVRVYPAEANSTAATTGSIYIQDFQLEQGLVATDYIETTTAPVYAGLTDNMPRLDYSGGAECGAYLLEPSRTNLVTNSEYGFIIGNTSIEYNNAISPEGYQNAFKSTATATGGVFTRTSDVSVSNPTISVFVKYGNNPWLNIIYSGNANTYFNFNCQTGDFGTSVGSATSNLKAEDYGNGWWRVSATFNYTGGGSLRVYMASSGTTGFANGSTTIGNYFYGYGFQAEQGSYPTSYIPTYGSSQTRAADVSTVSKTLPSEGSLFINVGGTSQPKLSVLGEYFDASTTANKVAIAYSSTALVISHNGSIVVDKTGTYDVSSLTQIQLGHSNGADQADSPISEFITFDSFLTNNELNALTQ